MKLSLVIFLIGMLLAGAFSVMAGDEERIIELRRKISDLKAKIEHLKNPRFGSGGAAVDPGTVDVVVPNGTIGSVLFVGSEQALRQDNSNFYWDDTNNRLGLGTSTPGTLFSLAGGLNFVSTGSSTIRTPLGIGGGTTSPSALFSVSTTTATTTLYVGGTNTTFGGCIQLHAASGTPYRLYIEAAATSTTQKQSPLRVEVGGCGDQNPAP